VAAIAPGGWLLVEDFDWAIGGPADDDAATLRKAYEAILELLESVGYQRHYGRTLPRRLEQAGLGDLGNDARAFVLHGGSAGTAFERFSFHAQRDRLIASQALTQPEVDEAMHALSDPARHILTPAMFAAWGRKRA
jgi:hypothetical protein